MQRPRTDETELDRRVRARRAQLESRARFDLGQYIVNTTPSYQRPTHLQPLLALLDASMRGPVFATISVPPRHGKTETLLHHLTRRMKYQPDRMNAYATYSSAFAARKSRKTREIAFRGRVSLDRAEAKSGVNPAATVGYWQTTAGGGLLAVGRGGGFTGDGVSGDLVVDDPHKDRKDAESVVARQDVWEWFTDVALTRLQKGASCFVVHTRWHADDLIGRIQASHEFPDWQHINLPALAEDNDPLGRAPGEALAPWIRDRAYLEGLRRRIGDYSFYSLYQGSPRPKGGKLFSSPRYYARLPDTALRVAYGVDMAYTKKSTADWSVIVWLATTKNGLFQDVYYVLHVDRVQVRSPEFGGLIQARLRHHHAPVYWRAVGPERGSVDLMREHLGVPFEVLPTAGDKFVHAQPAAAAWNDGRILLPLEDRSWKRDLEAELGRFTGVNDAEDDQVDALCNAFDGLSGSTALNYESEYDRMLPQMRI